MGSQILIVPSHDPVARVGFLVSWENLTAETQSWCSSSSTVYLHSPLVFQILIFLSLPPEAIYLLSAENEHVRTSLPWSTKVSTVFPFWTSQSLRVWSHEAERAYRESRDRARSLTKWEWPDMTFLIDPHSGSSSVAFLSVRFHEMTLLSLPPERRNSTSSPASFFVDPTWRAVTPPCLSWPNNQRLMNVEVWRRNFNTYL